VLAKRGKGADRNIQRTGNMKDRHIHIISFNIPYPPDYGGVIDVYHKIRWLHKAGVKVHLHCFEYGRQRSPELEKLCAEVYYYNRNTSFLNALSGKPYIVKSRESEQLLGTLQKDSYPVLFEALHTCSLLGHPGLKDRFKIYRESNVEHEYYRYLCRAENNLVRKAFFLAESFRLRRFEKVVKHASLILPVSYADTEYFREKYPQIRSEFLPSFHPNDTLGCIPGLGSYALYHGNLSVPENILAAEYLTDNIFSGLDIQLVIAGKDPPSGLKKKILTKRNIRLVENLPETEMEELIRHAHTNILVTFQPTGIKLKLLNALYKGRFCIVNPLMLEGTGLGAACITAGTTLEMKQRIKESFQKEFSREEIEKRKELLGPFDNSVKTEQLLRLVRF
jgi:hypothetical protein